MSKVNRKKSEYGWDNSCIAFGNPLDKIIANEKKRKDSGENARKKKKSKGEVQHG